MSDWVDIAEGPDAWEDVSPAPRSSILGPLATLGDALSMGGLQQFASYMTDLSTRTHKDPITYEESLADIRGAKDEFAMDSPYSATGLKIAGAVPMSLLAPESIPGQMAYFGLLSGLEQALTSAPEDKQSNALFGGTVGAAAPAAVYGITSAGKYLAQTGPVQRGLDAISDVVDGGARLVSGLGERGSVASVGDDGIRAAMQSSARTPTAGEAELMRRMRTVAPEKLEGGLLSLQKALDDNSPMFLPEAVQSNNIANLGKFLGQYEPTTDTMRGAVDARKAGAYDRITGILDEIAPERSVYEGGNKLYTAAKDKVDELVTLRKEAAETLFSDARSKTPIFNSPEVKGVIKEPKIEKVIKEVRRDFPEFDKLPDNAYSVLDEARRKLWSLREKALANDEPSLARSYDAMRVKLREAMGKENETYKKALSVFSEESKPITEFTGKAAKAILNVPKEYSHRAGSTLTGMQPEEISSLSRLIEDDGAIRAGFRSGLQSKLDSGDSGRNLASKIVDVPAIRQRLVAALGGDDAAASVMSKLERENLYGDFNNLYAPGSPTFRFFDEQRMLEGSDIAKVLSGNKTDILDKLSRALIKEYRGSEATAKEMAQIMTDPVASREFLETMMPIIRAMSERYQATGRAFDAAQPVLTTGAVAPVKSR